MATENADRNERRLVAAGWLFLVGSAVHLTDHLRRGQTSVTDALYIVGTAGVVVQAVVITLILVRHRIAPLLAAGAGFSLSLGFAAAHWLPTWSSLSDSFIDHHVSAFSVVASLLEIAGGVAVGVMGTVVYWNRPVDVRA
ncbi:MAG: hypothetical protein JWL72_486 [Ilumatobacteraceae bacterium]|nr:hypothetical protein [Ilumatobacteraceae bacterium]MCU1387148.1 hypothetical protein [Ilumatobacteraceae bacterium]